MLQPKWGGNLEDLADFYKSCVASDNLESKIPMVPFNSLVQNGIAIPIMARNFNGPLEKELVSTAMAKYLKQRPDDTNVLVMAYCMNVIWEDTDEAARLKKLLPKNRDLTFYHYRVADFQEQFDKAMAK